MAVSKLALLLGIGPYKQYKELRKKARKQAKELDKTLEAIQRVLRYSALVPMDKLVRQEDTTISLFRNGLDLL